MSTVKNTVESSIRQTVFNSITKQPGYRNPDNPVTFDGVPLTFNQQKVYIRS